ncbi:hypothetical protein BH23BAC1_BH23BAC1_47310 [soil metagenome]
MYYHRGEDFEIIPDKLDVIAPFDGKIVKSPVPEGDGKSNSLAIENNDGIVILFAHMNIENIKPGLLVGTKVKRGEVLGKTGMTWDGRMSQISDPHLHLELFYQDIKLASFPYVIEAYFKDYSDEVLAVAGGYRFSRPGLSVELDATRSIARPGKEIKDYEWRLSNGETIKSPLAQISYSRPGLYSEELIVKTKDGQEDRDYLQVRVSDPQFKKDVAYGWGYFYPVRDPEAGSPVLFWNRLVNIIGDTIIDFGDGTQAKIDKDIGHIYKESGYYTVTLSASGPRNEPVTIKFEVRVL